MWHENVAVSVVRLQFILLSLDGRREKFKGLSIYQKFEKRFSSLENTFLHNKREYKFEEKVWSSSSKRNVLYSFKWEFSACVFFLSWTSPLRFFLCCQIEAECQEGCLGVYLALFVLWEQRCGSSSKVCMWVWGGESYQGSPPRLNKPFVCRGCSLFWARCPPGCCLSALSITDKGPSPFSLSSLLLHLLLHF